ncbi:MAG: M6 family metalloprotease domain-containing protein [Bacteroidales bacterium]
MNKSYTFKRFLLFVFSIFYFSSFAAWLDFVPQTITQPDGLELDCFATGDEFYNWLHDANGFTIIQNHDNGFYYFAELNEGRLVPSAYVTGTINPASVGLTPWTNIPHEEMQAIRRNFFKYQMPEKPHLEGYSSPKDIKNEGTLNNLVVYIRFSDQNEFPEDTMQYYNMFNNTNFGYNSMQNYFETVSYNKISIPYWFYPQPSDSYVLSYQDTYPRSYFMPYDPVTNPNGYQSGQSGEREHALLKRACLFIEDEVPEILNLDKNNDGYIDNMVFIIRGATTAWATLLWPHRWALYNETVYINGKRAWDYNLQVEEHLNGSGAGVLCHEMFHSLSAPDLYHYNSAPFTSVGPWDLMDNANNPPESMGAYMKYRYGGWIDEIPEITECGTYMLNPLSEPENNCFKIASPNSNNEFFVLEYREKKGVFENSIPGTGLLVYRIDNTLNGNGHAQGPPDEVYVYRPGGNISTNGDLGLAHFAADYNRTEINDNTNPFPFLQNGQAGGLIISNVGYIGETISFDVYFEKAPVAQFETKDTLITEGCMVDFYDLSVCEVESWEWTFEGGTPSTSDEQNPMGIIFENAGYYNVSLKVTNLWGEDEITKTSLIHVCDITCPQINFYASDSVICGGASIQLSDFSKVCPEAWNWEIWPNTFDYINGTNEFSQNPEIEFYAVGEYSITLTVSNSNGNSSLTKDNYIKVGGTSIPFLKILKRDFQMKMDG